MGGRSLVKNFNGTDDHQPQVSVIVAAYNQEKYIGRCMRSLLKQSLPQKSYEIIVVDDGSIDKTNFALNLFSDGFGSPVRVITNAKNLGLPAALNIGILAARAPLIVRVDSDDFVNENFLNFLFQYMLQNPDCSAVACDYLLTDDSENIIKRQNCDEDPIACGIMFKSSALHKIGLYNEEFRFLEEKELRVRFEKKFKVERLAIPLYRYRRHANNHTNNVQQMQQFAKKLRNKVNS